MRGSLSLFVSTHASSKSWKQKYLFWCSILSFGNSLEDLIRVGSDKKTLNLPQPCCCSQFSEYSYFKARKHIKDNKDFKNNQICLNSCGFGFLIDRYLNTFVLSPVDLARLLKKNIQQMENWENMTDLERKAKLRVNVETSGFCYQSTWTASTVCKHDWEKVFLKFRSEIETSCEESFKKVENKSILEFEAESALSTKIIFIEPFGIYVEAEIAWLSPKAILI